MNIRICTFNVRGLGHTDKRRQIFEWLKLNKYDICLLQETHCEKLSYHKWEREWGGKCFFSGNSRNSRGVGILLNHNLSVESTNHNTIIEGRLQSLNITIDEKDFFIINQYAPNDDKTDFLQTLDTLINENDDKSFIIGGDFNTVMDTNIDKKGGNLSKNKNTREKLNEIVSSNDLSDLWRFLNPGKRGFTWHSNHKPPIYCRLDFFLVSKDIATYVNECKISTGFKSDHSLVYFNININKIKRGPGYFKLNNSILFDKEYQRKVRSSINDTVHINKDANPNTLWEVIKGNIRNETMSFTCMKRKKEKTEEEQLKNEIDALETQILENQNESLITKLKEKKNNLERIVQNRTNGIIIRAKAEWVEGAERNTKYFANLEKKKQETKTIKKLNINGTEITEPANVLNETKSFYKKLYKKDITSPENTFFNLEESEKLSAAQQTQCEGQINETECFAALKEMNNGKSPGSDGLTAEFYKLFWNDIKKHLLSSINYSHETGALTELEKQGIISLLPQNNAVKLETNKFT